MAVFELILCIIAAVVVSSFASRFVPKVSTPLVQIVLGVLVTYLPFFPDATLDPELFMVLFIAPLLYLEAHEIDKSALLKTLDLSLSLAIGLAIVTMAAVGFTLHAVWPSITLASALALGAALGPTDAVAVSSLGKEASLTQRQRSVLKGESLFNDASGIVGFQFALAAAFTGEFAVGQAAGEFLMSFFGGTLFGLVIAAAANWLFETVRSLGWETTTTRILMELFLPFLLYLGAEECQCVRHSVGGGRWPVHPIRPHRRGAECGTDEYRFHFSMGCAEFLAQRCGVHSSGHAAAARHEGQLV